MTLKRGNNSSYKDVPLTAEVARLLKPGNNTIAIHVDNRKSLNMRQKNAALRAGSQFIDAGIGEESITW